MSRSPIACRSLPCVALVVLAGCKASVSMKVATPGVEGQGRATVATRASGKARIVRTGDRLAYEGGEIEFATGSAELVGDSTEDVLDRLGEVLQQYPTLLVRIEGHTDSRGGRELNQKLSEERAQAIKIALVRRGIGGARLSTTGLGEEQPERVEPPYCLNRSEETVKAARLPECREIWTANRRAAFVVTEGAETLPPAGSDMSAAPKPAEPAKPVEKRPDWALRLFGGYSLALPGFALHGGHIGLGVHASQRFGAKGRGYIGGGPRLHYRGLRGGAEFSDGLVDERLDLRLHQFGPEGNLLVGGGSQKVVGLFSLRLGLGLSALKTISTTEPMPPMTEPTTTRTSGIDLGGWVLGGVVVLGKLTPRWSLGGHLEAGITRVAGPATFVLEAGLNVAWHFGRGRRDGI
jgi:outer membrane protein OmpA-like peptidoglycan-associated protein